MLISGGGALIHAHTLVLTPNCYALFCRTSQQKQSFYL